MGLNRKLSRIIAGRTIERKEHKENVFCLYFTDGSFLQLKIKGEVLGELSPGQKVHRAIEKDEQFVIDLEEGNRIEVSLENPGASVYLRNKEGSLEYLG
ncbi:hypothetical protein IT6_02215 [Methylacidiphilum caldifontis]|uniref:hypothetical protein n=1 Tax=Methylacidiphilum caldifontis TaxID=2795386 RepID=UPI001A8DF6BC|nr:hypothetical protein [Methylacidiphilum caldifontis]QSR89125.1 hypothetical protein IT6_02215 [Methylacidiphilum caldifontis]